MLIYPVLDLKEGQAVRAVGGDRGLYRPVRSSIVSSACPLGVARAFRRYFELSEIYVADLDAIAGGRPDIGTYRELLGDGFRLLLDAGLRSPRSALSLLGIGVDRLVAALETLPSPRVLEDLVSLAGVGSVIFSLDMKAGKHLGDERGWPPTVEEVARRAAETGVKQMLVLDLAQVGNRGGPGHLRTCRRLRTEFPTLRWLTGGGIRGRVDLEELEAAGFEGALVATALHDGSLTTADVRRFQGPRG